ncbi:hypothetical protein QF026_004088 [Streptomyces aurantiacus]|nr:LysR family transcriptional regulator [Streptomyces aurantiacus]MDQ0775622.1 hypothetical protein [Streptomyces aurantiacus]
MPEIGIVYATGKWRRLHLRLRQHECVLAVVEEGSMTAAAERLRVTQPF